MRTLQEISKLLEEYAQLKGEQPSRRELEALVRDPQHLEEQLASLRAKVS